MKIVLIQIDKTQQQFLEDGESFYLNRLKHYSSLETVTLILKKEYRKKTIIEQKKAEADLIIKKILPGDEIILLDEKGKEFTSEEFSTFLNKKMISTSKRLVFVIGGPYGFDESIYKISNHKVSFSRMTFSHQMIRLFFLEQLYRAFTIIRGEKYHHE